METRPPLNVSSDRLVKPEIEPATPGLQVVYSLYHSRSFGTEVTGGTLESSRNAQRFSRTRDQIAKNLACHHQ